MQAQHTYLVRFPVRTHGNPVVTTPTLGARFKEKHRTKKVRQSPIGAIREIERSGWDKSTIVLRINQDEAKKANGSPGLFSWMRWFEVPANRAGIIKHVRLLGPEHAGQMAAKDAEIEAALAVVARLRNERAGIVDDAFKHGEPAPFTELLDAAEATAKEFGP